jgi:hypothetical protein
MVDLVDGVDRVDGVVTPLAIQSAHDAAFNVEKVSKDFYREIANWYFWALKHVTFPKNAPKEQDGRDHISVIRLITRLIFCWFIREKGLIPDVLFDEAQLAGMLDGFAPKGGTDIPVCAKGKGQARMPVPPSSVYYRAILQNLFFATLNTEMDQRGWRRADQNFMAHSLYRHKECFRDPKAGLDWFKDIPFLNGGLFECLDRPFGDGDKQKYVRIDGFSDRPDSRPTVPDFLFFGSEQDVDLSGDYGDKKFRSVRVRGLIDTLNRYKFTIEENTPLDQEVALDPELCGKVFENLLAAYNPETGTTARKATGSFYTPREIVDYMVDESLVVYLKGKLEGSTGIPACGLEGDTGILAGETQTGMSVSPSSAESRIRALLAYDTEMPKFSEKETEALIDAIDSLKVLDPAVGSGAFPMGILHKLVHVLGKLDPNNEKWKAKQIAKLDDAVMREEAERVFRDNYDNYGRKLYLIENCIYGVDIQPIAVQIAKMRFFISLIVDQKVEGNTGIPACDKGTQTRMSVLPNLGVRALPNLETKFVAANTLIGIERPDVQGKLFANPRVDTLKADLAVIRHRMFTAKTTGTKNDLRKKDAALRLALAAEVEKAFRKANEDETRRTKEALAKATKELEDLQAKPVEWQVTRMKNLFGEEEETRTDPTKETKRRLRDAVKSLEARLRQATQFDEELDATAKQLAAWDPYDQNAYAPFFDPEWMFGLPVGKVRMQGRPIATLLGNLALVNEVKGQTELTPSAVEVDSGFDVVIGNPPYVRMEQIKQLKPLFTEIYQCFSGRADLYVYFFERSISLLRDGGVLSFITSNTFFNREFGEKLRGFLTKKNSVEILVDFGESGVFTAFTEPCISVVRRGGESNPKVRVLKWDETQEVLDVRAKIEAKLFTLPQSHFGAGPWRIESPRVNQVIAQLEKSGRTVGSMTNHRILYGVKTGLNEAFVIDAATRQSLIREDKNSAELIKPFLRGRDIGRWTIEPTSAWLIYIPKGTDMARFKAVERHLKPFKKALEGRATKQEWYELQQAQVAYYHDFCGPKIDCQDIARSYGMAWDEAGHFLANTCYFIPGDFKWLLGLLMSAPMRFYVHKVLGADEGGFIRLFSGQVDAFPIPNSDVVQNSKLEVLTNGLLWLNHHFAAHPTSQTPHDTAMLAYWERILNGLVYELYFPQEVHGAGLGLFDLVAAAELPDLNTIPEAQRLRRLREQYETLQAPDHPLRQALDKLQTLETVKIIEGNG